MMPGTVLEPGEIVQLNPKTVQNKAFAGCLDSDKQLRGEFMRRLKRPGAAP
jgi:hypothetical protein